MEPFKAVAVAIAYPPSGPRRHPPNHDDQHGSTGGHRGGSGGMGQDRRGQLRMQLRAVSVLVRTQRQQHVRHLAGLFARFHEVDARRGEQVYLLSFAAATEDIRRSRRTAGQSRGVGGWGGGGARAPGEPWQPPGGGVFLGPGPEAGQRSFNVHGQHRPRDSRDATPAPAPAVSASVCNAGPTPAGDPWAGSEFKCQMLTALADKLLLKAVMGVFAAAAADSRWGPQTPNPQRPPLNLSSPD